MKNLLHATRCWSEVLSACKIIHHRDNCRDKSIMATLKGKIIAITGAGSGIGWATAHECASRGASLALCDINKHSVDKLVAELVSKSAKVLGTCVDIGNSDNVDAWIAQIIEQFGRLDGAVNAAGIVAGSDGVIFSHIVDTSNEHWNSVLQINATGLFYCLRAELRVMEPGASIVNMSSLAGLMGQERLSPYIASKHAVIGLTRAAAKEAGAKGIRVNALAA